MSLPKKLFFSLIVLFFVVFFIEFFAYNALRRLELRGVVYYPYDIDETEYNEYLNKRDEILGWPLRGQSSAFYGGNYDLSGSRFIPAFPEPDRTPACVSLYGDSYTYGAMVEDGQSWGNILAMFLNCRVSNYGLAAYGTDQAYLRFRDNINDKSQVVILGYFSENILRNINQYRPFLYCNAEKEKFALKPRFIIDNQGQLELVPLPNFSYQNFLQMLNSPKKYLKYDYFVPGGNAGVYKREFPYTISLTKVLLKNFHIRAKAGGIPWYMEFYQLNHPSGALKVTFAIMKQFYSDADKLYKKPFILIIPTALDLEYYNTNKKWPYESLKNLLRGNKMDFIDAGPGFIEYLKNRDPKELFVARHHFNEKGEKILAGIVYAYLKEK